MEDNTAQELNRIVREDLDFLNSDISALLELLEDYLGGTRGGVEEEEALPSLLIHWNYP